MRDFFSHQETARRNSLWLTLSFLMATTAIVGVVSVALYLLTTFAPGRLYFSALPFNLSPRTWNLALLGKIALTVLALILLGTLYKYLRLRSGGGSLVAQMLGGRVIYPDSDDWHERRLLNIVEEMAIASGITVPSVYLLEKEAGINAFAAGFSQEDAVLGVTRGALLYLSREELQGVIAHEFSHILYGDMLLNIRLQGLLHGILVIGLLGEALLRGASSSERAQTGRQKAPTLGIHLALLGLLLLALGSLGVLVGRIIKSAVARQREFLADASAVQFTRNPAGLAGALKKIGGFAPGSQVRATRAAEVSHIFFSNGLAENWLKTFSTHPPLAERIRRLEPGFSGEFPREIAVASISEEEALSYAAPRPGAGSEITAPLAGEDAGRRHAFIHSLAAGRPLREALRDPGQEHLRVAREMLASFPPRLLAAARNGFGARAVVYALLLDHRPEIRERQLALLTKETAPSVWEELQTLLPLLAAIPLETRLPLVDLTIPALKGLSEKQLGEFRRNVRLIVQSDGRIELFEYALHHLLLRRLQGDFGKRPGTGAAISSIARLAEELSCLLSLLSRHGHTEEGAAQMALMKAARLFGKERKHLAYLPPDRCGLKEFDRALRTLAAATPAIRAQTLAAALECIVADEKVTILEAELFRTIAEALNCPAPPWLTLRPGDRDAAEEQTPAGAG